MQQSVQLRKKTKILCTLGPSSSDIRIIKNMYDAGMNAVRINTAHGEFRQYAQFIKDVRKTADIPVVMDIKGPEIRVRCKEKILIAKNTKLEIGFSSKHDIYLNHNILDALAKDDLILINDGKFAFKVERKYHDHVIVKAAENSMIEPDKNVNIPGKKLNLPSLSKKDIDAIEFSKRNHVEYIALSFCRSKKDITNLQKKIGKSAIKIIAKIENKEGIDNIQEIIEYADGIMVARGDLGVEIPGEEVPLIQKKIIRLCNEKGKLVIVATQMLESMINNPTATRAEISDIANAVLDGTDCVMLSGETALGKYPVEAVKTMSKVAIEVEPQVSQNINEKPSQDVAECIADSVRTLAKTLPITKIVCLTYTGHTANMIARFRLDIPIYAITGDDIVRKQLMLHYALEPIQYKDNLWSAPVSKIADYLYKKKIIRNEDMIIFTAGLHTSEGKKTI